MYKYINNNNVNSIITRRESKLLNKIERTKTTIY